VLHDTPGFEAGEIENFNKVKDFIDRRRNMPHVKDRLHAVWYVSYIMFSKYPFDVPTSRLCLLIPRTGGRLIESGDEEFLKLDFGDSMFCASVCFCAIALTRSLVPVVIVFTKYDRLCDQINYDLNRSGQLKGMNLKQQKQQIMEEADKYFQENCVKQLKSIAHKPKRLKWVWVSSMNFIQPF
jgi:hypothetical protein